MMIACHKLKNLAIAVGIMSMALFMAGPSYAYQSGTYTDYALQGHYAFSFSGELITANGPVALAAVGQVQFDGQGNAPGAVRTIQIGTLLLKQTAVGTYTVNPDGTGTATFQVTTVDPPHALPVSTETFSFSISNNGKDFQFISTTPGVVARGTAERQ